MTPTWLRVGGRPAQMTGRHSAPVWETLADGGCGEASWTWHLPPHARPIGLSIGARVEIFHGGQPVYLGRVSDIDRETWGITAKGLLDDAVGLPALDGSGNATRNIATAVATARTSPWNWQGRNSRGITGTVTADLSEPLMLSRLLEMWSEESGERVGVDECGELYSRTDATSPKWVIAPRDAVLSSGSVETYNMYVGRYRTATGNATAYSSPLPDGSERVSAGIVDLTQRGIMSALNATAVLTKILQATKSSPTWTNGLTLSGSQIRTMGNQPAPLSFVKGGDRVRVVGLTPAQQQEVGGPFLDVTLKRVVQTANAPTIEVEPVGALPMSLEEAQEAVA